MNKQQDRLSATLTSAWRHRRLNRAVQGLLLWLAAVLVVVIVAFAADNLLNLPPGLRLAGLLGFVAALLALAIWLAARCLFAPMERKRLAVRLEQLLGIRDNSLINAVHFADDAALEPRLQDVFRQAAEHRCQGARMTVLWDFRRLRRLGLLAGAALLLAIGYGVCFRQHARNAFWRFVNPNTALTPVNYTQFAVEPGDRRLPEGSNVLVRATASKFGRRAHGLRIQLEATSGRALYPMTAENEDYRFQIKDLREDLAYRIQNGNDVSKWYRLEVARRPRLRDFALTVTPPAYTAVAAAELEATRRHAGFPAGSAVTLRARAPGELRLHLGDQDIPAGDDGWRFTLDADAEARLDLEEPGGVVHRDVWRCRFTAVPDRPPTVAFLNKELNVQAAIGQTLRFDLRAEDDYALTGLELFIPREDGSRLTLKDYQFTRAAAERREMAMLLVDPRRFAVNASYRIFARVTDNHPPPREGLCLVPVTLHVIDPAKIPGQAGPDDPYTGMFRLLGEALTTQKDLQGRIASAVDRPAILARRHLLVNRQQHVHTRISQAAAAADKLRAAGQVRQDLHDAIATLRDGASAATLDQAKALPDHQAAEDSRKIALNELVLAQAGVIRELQEILGQIGRRRAEREAEAQRLASEEEDQQLLASLEQLRDKLKEFRESQKKIVRQTEAIDKKEPEDWTEEEEELLGDLAAQQADLSNFFKASFNDLSKLQNQDFSNSMMADELVELYEELQKAGEALKHKQVEMAIPAEHMGLELAESVEFNIERWLADFQDYIKWTAEESGMSPDVPLQDLPQELTDIVGDLIDDVQQMAEEDTEDGSTGYLGSFDEGIGWGVSDGTLNDMSAKGITGNVMPNDSEVGGRSGEGRSGKSSGQFVEKEAKGKGGRDTPTRLTQSPYEQGTVKDTSKDPQGGATGGGKQSGVGADGLRGIPPPAEPDHGRRLPGQQAELKQRAEALLRTLSVHNLPTADLEDAIAKMALIESRADDLPGIQRRQLQNDVVASLRDAQAVVETTVNSGHERSRRRDAARRRSRFSSDEDVPEGYEGAVQAYFQALAEGE